MLLAYNETDARRRALLRGRPGSGVRFSPFRRAHRSPEVSIGAAERSPVSVVARGAHHSDDLLDRRRIGGIAHAPVARRASGVEAGHGRGDRRRPAPSSSRSVMAAPRARRHREPPARPAVHEGSHNATASAYRQRDSADVATPTALARLGCMEGSSAARPPGDPRSMPKAARTPVGHRPPGWS